MTTSELLNAYHAARNKAEGVKWVLDLRYKGCGWVFPKEDTIVAEHARLTAEADRLWEEYEVAVDSEPEPTESEPTLPQGYGVHHSKIWRDEGAGYIFEKVGSMRDDSIFGTLRQTFTEAANDAHAHHLNQQSV